MSISMDEIIKATRLTREGRLGQATEAIQRALGALAPGKSRPTEQPERASARDEDVTDIAFRELPRREAPAFEPQQPSQMPAPAEPGVMRPTPSSFTEDACEFEDKRYRFRLFRPSGYEGMLPMVVMLHGCKQDSADFARGTAMNDAAQQRGFIVLYPEQLRSSNTMGCWNWFEPAHQKRGSGEPAMIATLAQQVAHAHGGDPARIYVAGLSAGAAMALLAAQLYPDVFAAVGVHSGLPTGAAVDVVSAFAAMRKGSKQRALASAVPAVVFHGTGDKTVHPSNGRQIVDALLEQYRSKGQSLEAKRETIDAGGNRRRATRTVHVTSDGRALVELWELSAGPHAWSGGDASGSYTDPTGPDASAAMLDFFQQHRSE